MNFTLQTSNGRSDLASRQIRFTPELVSNQSTGMRATHDNKVAARNPNAMTILVIDDQTSGRMLLTEILRNVDPSANIEAFSNALDALTFAESNLIDLVITDYKMPKIDGIEAIRRLRNIPHVAEIPIICVTIVGDMEVRLKALEAGANDFLMRPLDQLETAARCKNALLLRRHQTISHNYTKELEFRVEKVTQEVRLGEMETLLRLAKVAEQRDSITGQHLVRMAKYSALLARECGWSKEDQYAIEISSPLHDIGKIGIPDTILQAQRGLTAEEWAIMKGHAEIGYEMLCGSQSRFLRMAAEIARGHHEKFDGSGYPFNLVGEMIPLEARIVAIADVYDALTSERQYKRAWTVQETKDHMLAESGKHFDPKLLKLFFNCTDELEYVQKTFSDRA
jgi:response regulator RpfG family c-di-GMP phosphodiesterase